MKLIHFSLRTAVCALALSLAATVFAQSQPGYATVVRVAGEARYSADGGGTWHPIVIGQTFTAGYIIQTASGSTADLVLGKKISRPIIPNMQVIPTAVGPAPDSAVRGFTSDKATAEQNVIHMESDSVLAINTLTIGDTGVDAVSDTELDLRQGTIFGNVKKLSATSQYLIKTPNGIAGVRGTTFIISANGNITLIAGSMVASYVGSDGKTSTVVLGPGDQYNEHTGIVTHLTEAELTHYEHYIWPFLITLCHHRIHAIDDTIIYISPTTGHRA